MTVPLPENRDTHARLQKILQRQLRKRRLSAVGSPEPPTLTLLGVTDHSSSVLRSTSSEIPDSVLGVDVPARFPGVVAFAQSKVRTADGHEHAPARLAVGVWRDGTEACRIASDELEMQTTEPRGWLVDVCRRSLGLPTAPCDEHPTNLSIALWLDLLMVHLIRGGNADWDSAISLCPVPTVDQSDDPDWLGESLALATWPWSGLRQRTINGVPLPVPVRPEHAAWMDDAMFARWCLGFFPDLGELRSDVAFLAPIEVASRVEETIEVARWAFDVEYGSYDEA